MQTLFYGSSASGLWLYWRRELLSGGGARFWRQCSNGGALCGCATGERGGVIAKPQGRAVGRFGKLAQHADILIENVRAEPDITLQELAGALKDMAPSRLGNGAHRPSLPG